VTQDQQPAPSPTDQITIDEFRKVSLRVGLVIAAERVPKSTRLLKLQVDIGTERRQVVAGIGTKYAPEDLVGKRVVIVTNLSGQAHGRRVAGDGPGRRRGRGDGSAHDNGRRPAGFED